MLSRLRNPALVILCVALVVMGLLTVRPGVTYACSCVVPDGPQALLERSAAVFSGEVVSIKEKQGVVTSTGDPVQVTFKVANRWKGVEGDEVTVTTAMSSASCGFEFTEGSSYLVYAGGAEGKLQVSLCSRTVKLASAGEDLEALGPGTSPSVSPSRAESAEPPQGVETPPVAEGGAGNDGGSGDNAEPAVHAAESGGDSARIYVWSGVALLAIVVIVVMFRYRSFRMPGGRK